MRTTVTMAMTVVVVAVMAALTATMMGGLVSRSFDPCAAPTTLRAAWSSGVTVASHPCVASPFDR